MRKRVFVSSQEQNGTSVPETIWPTMLVFGKEAFQMLFFQNNPTNSKILKNYFYDIITLELYRDIEGTIESVCINAVSLLRGLNVEKM